MGARGEGWSSGRESFDAGVAAVNSQDPRMLYPLLERAAERLHEVGEVLTVEENATFASKFGLNAGEAETIVRFCTFASQSPWRSRRRRRTLRSALRRPGSVEQHCLAFGTAWRREAEGVLKRVKKKAFGAPASLASVDWRIHLQVTGSDEALEKVCPKAVLDLELQDQSKEEEKGKVLSLEFKEDLERLYNNFEEIQGQLDALT